MLFFTQRGYILWLAVFFWIIYRHSKAKDYKSIFYLIVAIASGVFISDWFSLEIKNLVQRVRPCHIEYFRGIVGCTGSYSFPSNHATNSMAVATILALFVRNSSGSEKLKKLIYLYIFSVAFLICLSRVYLGVHWVTDVVGGAFLGLIIGFGIFKATVSVNSLKRFFYFFLLILSLFRIYFILHGPVDLSPDEAHYWEWSRRLDLSYYSKGPAIAYLIALSTWIFGDNPFGVRILAVVCSFLSSIFIYKIGEKLFNEKTGYLSGIFFQLIPLFATFGVLFTIDSPFILFWIVSMYLFLLAIDGRRVYWIFLGLFIGLGLLTKYTMAFFYLSMFTYLLSMKKKDITKLPMSLLSLCILISLIVFSPVLIWNAQHGWVTLKHTAGQAHVYDGLKISLKYLFEFIGSQLAVVTPLIFILGLYFIFNPSFFELKPHNFRTGFFRQYFFKMTQTQWFMISFSMPVFVFFLLKSIQGKVQANWAMPAYVVFVIAIASAFERKILKKFVYLAIIVAVAFTFINYAIAYLNLPAKIDPSSRLKGWKELGIKVSEIKKELENSGKVILFSDKYQISSELAFYIQNSTVYCIPLGRRMNQYDLWESINNELKNKPVHGIYVVYGIKEHPQIEVSSAFEKCIPESFTVYKKRVKIRDYTIFRCYNFKGMILPEPESY